jgi:hypothetical protein
MTVGEWLATRTPRPPPQPIGRVVDALGPFADEDARRAPERCIEAAERVVARLLHEGRTGRDSAVDLLAADALVTYAFEAAAADPERLTGAAWDAMLRLSGLGAAHLGPARAGRPSGGAPGRG